MTAYNKLALDLIAFFGVPLGCTDPAFPAYTGNPVMSQVHMNMNISVAQFDTFNQIFTQTLFTLGVDLFDRDLVYAVLSSFQSQIVIPIPPPGTTGDPDLVALGYWLHQDLDCNIAVYWKYLTYPNPTQVEMALRRPDCSGFVAIGWPRDSGYYMIGSDAIMGWQNGSVYTYYLAGKNKDTTGALANDLLTVSTGSVEFLNGTTTIFFTRNLADGYNPITDPSNVVVLVSTHDTTNALAYHTCNAKTTYVLNLNDGTGYRGGFNNPQKNTHGIMMLVGWGIFIPLGMIFARYGREQFPDGLWFKFHQFFMFSGMCLTTAAFVVSWVMVDGVYFNTAFHAQLGIAIMLLGYTQFFMGVFRPHKEEGEKATGLRAAFEIIHPNIGRLLIIVSAVNIFAGISTWWPNYVSAIYACCVVLPLAVIIVLGEIRKRSNDDIERA